MKRAIMLALALLTGSMGQAQQPAGLGEIVVTGNRQNARYAQAERPVVGLRRQADFVARPVSISSDARDAATRTREIHTMLAAAIDRAAAAGVELVSGSFELQPVTRANYQSLPFTGAGRVDTSQVNLLVKTRLAGSTAAAGERLDGFVKALPRSGRGAIDSIGGLALTIVDPDQYRDAIVKLVADEARAQAAAFGPDYALQISGIDAQVAWSQVGSGEVFLYLPYRYTIVPR
jgi:uncharacterized protein YggE